jgi:hypothetical protein
MNIRMILAGALSLAVSSSIGCHAENLPSRVSQLEGDWVATLGGSTGCGVTSMLVRFHLDASGSGAGTATVWMHSTGCKDSHMQGQDFGIVRMTGKGEGTAGLSCGTDCGWKLRFQVNRENDVMVLGDVTALNGPNTPTGTAVKQ